MVAIGPDVSVKNHRVDFLSFIKSPLAEQKKQETESNNVIAEQENKTEISETGRLNVVWEINEELLRTDWNNSDTLQEIMKNGEIAEIKNLKGDLYFTTYNQQKLAHCRLYIPGENNNEYVFENVYLVGPYNQLGHIQQDKNQFVKEVFSNPKPGSATRSVSFDLWSKAAMAKLALANSHKELIEDMVGANSSLLRSFQLAQKSNSQVTLPTDVDGKIFVEEARGKKYLIWKLQTSFGSNNVFTSSRTYQIDENGKLKLMPFEYQGISTANLSGLNINVDLGSKVVTEN